ncbi:MAG: NADPH:quinone reductase, partial [Pseudomonadales bacterium]
AAWFDRLGAAADVLEVGEQPTPAPGRGEVLVRLAVSGVNPSDVKKRAGSFPDLLDGGYVIPHSDGAGVIEAVGDGVPRGRIGERVWVYQAQFQRRFGTAAEYVALDATRAVSLPEAASFEEGACLGIPAMTAHRCVHADGPVAGQRLLVTGGAGRVGRLAIQIARAAGARVAATASNPDDEALVRALGAETVVNHRQPGWGQALRDALGGALMDRVIDVEFGANLPEVLDVIRVGGTIATYASSVEPQPKLPFFRMMYMDLTVRLVIVYAMPEAAKQAAAAAINAALTSRTLALHIGAVEPLDRIAQAHALVEQGAAGCVLVSLP